jgi:hypothetical protein
MRRQRDRRAESTLSKVGWISSTDLNSRSAISLRPEGRFVLQRGLSADDRPVRDASPTDFSEGDEPV